MVIFFMEKFWKITILTSLLTLLLLIDINVDHKVHGEKYANYTVVIDAGHGGYDDGASDHGVIEKDINLRIAIYLKNYLEKLGIQVVMIRDTDIDFRENIRGKMKRTDLNHRLEVINESNADLLISIHMNAMQDGRWHGAQTFYHPNEENKQLAESIQKSLIDILQNTDRKTKATRSLYILRHSEPTSALVECGFLSNYEEAKLLETPIYQDKVAFAIYLGIIEYLSTLE